MKTYAKFKEIPLNRIQPAGWLQQYLVKQKDGLTGHLEHAGSPFDQSGWALPKTDIIYEAGMTSEWWPYEQTGYWIDGMIRCGYLLRDEFLITKAKKHIDYVLDHPDEDGFLGPVFLKEPGKMNRWVHAVFFRALIAHYSATGDARVITALANHYLSETSPHSHAREVCNVEEILWTYEQTGDSRLLDHAVQAYSEFCRLSPESDNTLENMLSDRTSTEHGVSFNEIAKLGAILYIYTGEKQYLDATVNAYRKIDRDQMLIDGVHSSSEHLRGKDALDSHETCDISEFTWSMGYLLQATGEAEYADKIERACFNAAPGAVDGDFKALQYFSCPNQVVADKASNHNLFYRGTKWMSYRPNPGTECCPGEVNKIMPNFAARMWLDDGNHGLVAAFYGPSSISAKVGADGKDVMITEETDYPFRDTVTFRIHAEEPVPFALTLRIPGWCSRAALTVNGSDAGVALRPGTFVKLEREFRQDDCITLTLPMDVKLSRWPGGGIGIERGPLVYSLRIDENWQQDPEERKCTEEFPAWNLYPASKWNYALAVNEGTLEKDVEVVYRDVSQDPWKVKNAPIELRVPAWTVKGWEIEKTDSVLRHAWFGDCFDTRNVAGEFMLTPPLPPIADLPDMLGTDIEKVTLVPYGCTRLRITIFPDGFLET